MTGCFSCKQPCRAVFNNLHNDWRIKDNFFTPLILCRDGKCYLCCYRVQCVMWQLLHKLNRAFQVPFKFPGFYWCHFSILAGFHSSWIFLGCLRKTESKHARYPANAQHCHSFSRPLPLLLSSLHLSPCLSWRAVAHFVLQIWESPQTPSWFSSHLLTRKKKSVSVHPIKQKKLKRKTNSELKIWKVSDAVCCVTLRWYSSLNMKRMKFHWL